MNINWQKKWKTKDEAKAHILRHTIKDIQRKGWIIGKHEGLGGTMDFFDVARAEYFVPEKKKESRFKR